MESQMGEKKTLVLPILIVQLLQDRNVLK